MWHLVPTPECLAEESPSPSPGDATHTRAKKKLRTLQPADIRPGSRPSLRGRETAIRGACRGPTPGWLPPGRRLCRRGPDSTVVTDLPAVTHPVPGGARTGTRFCLAGPNPGLLGAPSLAGPWLYFRPSVHVVSVRDGSVPAPAAAETRGRQERQAPAGGHHLHCGDVGGSYRRGCCHLLGVGDPSSGWPSPPPSSHRP